MPDQPKTKHKGGRPQSLYAPGELPIVRVYMPFTIDSDVERATKAQEEVLKVINKPNGVADKVYRREVERYKQYVNPKIVPNGERFEDVMYQHVYHQFKDSVASAIFRPDVVSEVVNPKSRSRLQWRNNILSEDELARIKIDAVLRRLMLSLANDYKGELGLVDDRGRFSVSGHASKWQQGETVSLSAPVGSDPEGPAKEDLLPGPVEEQPDYITFTLSAELADQFPESVRPHLTDIVDSLAGKISAGASPEDIKQAVTGAVNTYADERLAIIDSLDEIPDDAAYWSDPGMRANIADTIASGILSAQAKEAKNG